MAICCKCASQFVFLFAFKLDFVLYTCVYFCEIACDEGGCQINNFKNNNLRNNNINTAAMIRLVTFINQ
uniref:Secreted protein n=1 Tax=Anguilla anguilla TaxID=7936 RepID=A0A0E9S9S4_ANGAN